MDRCRTRKSTYKLRKIGKFNYSLTIPPTIVEYLGGYDKDNEYYLFCKDGNVIISNNADPTTNDVEGWSLELNTMIPFIRKNNVIIGYNTTIKSYVCYIDGEPVYGQLDQCINYVESLNISVPKVLITALKRYIRNL